MTHSVVELYEMREQLKEVGRLIAENRESNYAQHFLYTNMIYHKLIRNEIIPPEVKRHYDAVLEFADCYQTAEEELPKIQYVFDMCESQYKTTGKVSDDLIHANGALAKLDKDLSNLDWKMSTSLNILKDFCVRPARNSRVTEESNSVQKAKIPRQVSLESKSRSKPRNRSFGIFEIAVAIMVFLWWRNHDFSTASFENGIPVRNEHEIFGSWYAGILAAFLAGFAANSLRNVWRWVMK